MSIVDYLPDADVARVANFRYETSISGWIFLEKLRPHVIDHPDPGNFTMRTFKTNGTLGTSK